jgi:predicted DNA-binding protein
LSTLSDRYATMSDRELNMASQRITIRVPRSLGSRLAGRSRASGKTPSEVVRVALETYLGEGKGSRSAFEAASAAGLIGCASGLPKDLSTNRRHMEGFGKGK